MKKNVLFLIAIVFAAFTFAQAPQAFKFQTVVRDGNGEVLPLQDITLKFQIRKDSPEGDVAYAEQHFVTTNSIGLVSLNIGGGEPISGTFESISWGDGSYFLEELIDIGNTDDFQVFGTVQLLSVPYALHANTAGNGIQSMSTEDRDALENPAVGTQIYNTTTNCLNYWSGNNWFETCGDCTPQPDNANAGPDQTFNDSTTVAQLEANYPEFGQGEWTKTGSFEGYFDDPTDPNTQFHGEPCKVYYLQWTISTNCGSNTDNVKVSFDDTPSQAQAGADIIINSDTTAVSLDALVPENGDGLWSVISGDGGSFDDPANPATQFTGLDCEMYQLLWKVSTECHFTTDTLNVEFYAIPTQAIAGADTTINDENLTITLNGNTPEVGTGAWSIISGEGGTLAEPGNPVSEFTAAPCETYELVWAISTACKVSTDTVMLYFFTFPTEADAGADQLGLNGTWTNLAANTPEIGEGQWTILIGEGGQITNPISPTSIFLGQNMMFYELQWKITTQCDTTRDEVSIAFGFTLFQECGDTLIDVRDGRYYKTVQIGDQCWMAENLSYLPAVSPPSQGSDTEPYYYVYDYQGTSVSEAKATDNYQNYGVLYNWPASLTACPTDWHLPTDAQWAVLTDYLGGINVAGGKMKETGTTHWNSPNTGATNSSGFTALPGGNRDAYGAFYNQDGYGYWWSSSATDATYAWNRGMSYLNARGYHYNSYKAGGFSLRCLMSEQQNQPPETPSTPNPDNGASNISIDVNLSWSGFDPENDPLTYNVYFGTEPTPPQASTAIADTFYTPVTLEYATTYFWKIVANDDQGNSTVGEVWSFTTLEELEWQCGDTLIDDRDGEKYATVQIGEQCWMVENLAYLPEVSSLYTSDIIPYYYVSDYQGTDVEAAKATDNYQNYGVLYNWPASITACPSADGWHLPSDSEWTVLTDYLGVEGVAGGEMKSTRTEPDAHPRWASPNNGATNSSGFTALPGGHRYLSGLFYGPGGNGYWWSSSTFDYSMAWFRHLSFYYVHVSRDYNAKSFGLSVRCLKD